MVFPFGRVLEHRMRESTLAFARPFFRVPPTEQRRRLFFPVSGTLAFAGIRDFSFSLDELRPSCLLRYQFLYPPPPRGPKAFLLDRGVPPLCAFATTDDSGLTSGNY